MVTELFKPINDNKHYRVLSDSTMREPIHHSVARLFSELQNSGAMSALVNYFSINVEVQILSLKTMCIHELFFKYPE